MVFLHQPPERLNEHGQLVPVGAAELTLADHDGARMAGDSVYFVRVNPKGVTPDKPAGDIAVGTMRGSALDTLRTMVNHLFHPALKAQKDWGKLNGSISASRGVDGGVSRERPEVWHGAERRGDVARGYRGARET